MKVVLVIPTLVHGGAERVMSELANHFDSLGHEVVLVLLANADDFYSISSNVKIYRLGFENLGPGRKQISEIITFFKLRKIISSYRPDAVLSFMLKYNLLTVMSSRFLNVNIYVSERSNPKKPINRVMRFLQKVIYRRASGIIAQTALAKEVIYKTTKHKNIRIIPNPARKVALYDDTEREKIILNVGRLVPEKGHRFLIEMYSELNAKDWKLVILGEGPLRNELENQIFSLGLQEEVILKGAVEDVDYWLGRSSIFVFSSISEGFPNALVEAMVAGLPCVSFDCDAGPRDIILNGNNGFLVPVGDVIELKKVVLRLTQDRYLREKIGKNAQLISKELTLGRVAQRYLDFMSETHD